MQCGQEHEGLWFRTVTIAVAVCHVTRTVYYVGMCNVAKIVLVTDI